MRRLAGGNPAHAAEAEVADRLLRQPQVAEMHRIEGAAENAERLRQSRQGRRHHDS
jgi:hypothetical protein